MDGYVARGYQLEMLDQSLKENIILVMDTGSGKTHVASMRITAELARCSSEKTVWFLTPTVALAAQQKEAIALHIPAINIRLLIGDDGVDRWSEQRIWDAALCDMSVVVSTHAVLADALAHGFVRMEKLALIVFDEAHHCVKNHPGNRIMRDFYHPTKKSRGLQAVPHILGLTASPIMKSKVADIRKIEENLDAVSRTPQLQRQELMKYVHRPNLSQLAYPAIFADAIHPEDVASLQVLFQLLPDRNEGPCSDFTGALISLIGAKAQDQMTRFFIRAMKIYYTLGAWAADFFIIETTRRIVGQVKSNVNSLWVDQVKVGLAERLEALLHTSRIPLSAPGAVSGKVERLLSFLQNENHGNFFGIVFVKERAASYVLAELVAQHPATRDVFRCASCMSSTNRSKKHDIFNVLDPDTVDETLLQFREGGKNLIVATDVLEEGIDLTACHLVVCFDHPSNLKSFIQRRGRARQQQSTFAIMIADDDMSDAVTRWQELEEEMIRLYQDDKRTLQQLEQLENLPEDVAFQLRLRTGALLTANTAVSHLYHFCTTLQSKELVDLRPRFKVEKEPKTGRFRATVILPSSLDPTLRVAQGLLWWLTERAAKKDAAFQAYTAMHRAKLVNDNFLPLTRNQILAQAAEGHEEILDRPKLANFDSYDPWKEMSGTHLGTDVHRSRISIKHNGIPRPDLGVAMITPVKIPEVEPLTLYWDSQTTFEISLEKSEVVSVSPLDLKLMRETTHTLLNSARTKRPEEDDKKCYAVLITPDVPAETASLEKWLGTNRGTHNCLTWYNEKSSAAPPGIIRSHVVYNRPHQFVRWILPENGSELLAQVRPFKRNWDVLHQNSSLSAVPNSNGKESEAKDTQIQARACTSDRLPWEMGRVSILLPQLMHGLQRNLVAARLRETLLRDIPGMTIRTVAEAITCPSVQWTNNYQRLEFLGDAVLKYAVCIQLFHDNPLWPEGYLTQRKSHVVSNASLTDAAMRAGLEKYLFAKALIARKWTVPTLTTAESLPAPPEKELSSKMAADALEALIGAAYVDGGMALAWSMIHLFLPNVVRNTPPSIGSSPDHNLSPIPIAPPHLDDNIDQLVGYHFTDRSLIWEALTHPSWQRDLSTASYQRLEFLGDALLDLIINRRIFAHTPAMSESTMTHVKAALVNAHFLAFLCMEHNLETGVRSIQQSPQTGTFDTTITKNTLELWKFMRFDNPDFLTTQRAFLQRHANLRDTIKHQLECGDEFPWGLLTKLRAEKCYSDIIESIIGAIFIDTHGDIDECEKFLHHIGMMKHLGRVLVDNVIVEHPRTRLYTMVGSRKVEYNDVPGKGNVKDVGFGVRVTLDGEELATVLGCFSKDEAVASGAEMAVERLREILSTLNEG